MNLQQLRYLVAIADGRTMTEAAAQLHVAQPALSRAMKSLEAELAVRLFEPSGRSLRLTRVGEDVVDAARAALVAVDRVAAVARAHRDALDPLVVVTTPTLEPLFTRHVLPAYFQRHPDRSARLRRASGREEVGSMVLDGEATVGLSDLPVADGLVVVPLGEFEVVLLSPAGSTLPALVRWEDLDGVPMILPSAGSTRRTEFDAFFAALGVRPVVALESDERGSWLEGVLAGIGSVMWYGERANNAIERGARLSRFVPPLQRAIGLCHRSGPLPPELAGLLELALELGLPEWAHT